jgi:formate dehydrogenase subunit gamma
MFAAALLSGLGVGDDGGGPMLAVHVAAVVLLAAGLLGALTFGDRSAVLTAARRLFVLDRRDRTWLVAAARHPLARRSAPEWGMFNAAQKVLAWLLAASIGIVVGTGIQSWLAGGEGGLHGAFAVVTLVLLACHVFMAVVNPSTRPALRGMVRGYVSRSWAATHHAQWLRENDQR